MLSSIPHVNKINLLSNFQCNLPGGHTKSKDSSGEDHEPHQDSIWEEEAVITEALNGVPELSSHELPQERSGVYHPIEGTEVPSGGRRQKYRT